jgi:hypothetical protein
MRRSLPQDEQIAVMVSRSAVRLFNQAVQARTVSKWSCAAAIIVAGFLYLTVASHVGGAVVPIEQIRSPAIGKTIVPGSVENPHLAAGPGRASSSSPVLPAARFRFGFLEFEDNPD